MFTQCIIFCVTLFYLQTSLTSSVVLQSNCHPDIDIRFGEETNNLNQSSMRNKKPHAEILSHDRVAYGFLSTANLALKLAGNECRQDICLMAKNVADMSDKTETAVAYTALTNMPYGLYLLLCSDVVIRSIKVEEIMLADDQHEGKVQTARTRSVENEAYIWRFEPVDDCEKRLLFRIRNVKTNQYLIADRKFSLFGDNLRRIVLTDPKKSDIWEIKMMSDFNGNFNRFMIMNVLLGEYLYASRGFCYDNVANIKECSTRPLFTWEYKTFKEVEEDEYNRFIIDDYVLD